MIQIPALIRRRGALSAIIAGQCGHVNINGYSAEFVGFPSAAVNSLLPFWRQIPNSSFSQIILACLALLIYLPYYPVLQLTTRPRLCGKHIWCRLASKLQNGTSSHLLVQLCQIQNTKYLIQIPNAGLLESYRTPLAAIPQTRCNYAKYKIPNT